MKKIKFLNGIGGMCAFAVVALVGSLLFTSCEKEDLNATFETEPAKATITVNVVEFFTGADVTSSSTITADKGTVAGAVVTIPANADGTITAQDVTINATYNNVAASPATVHINALKAGGVATYYATLVVAIAEEGDEIVIKTATAQGASIVSQMGGITHNHDGLDWWYNMNEYILVRSIDYTIYNNQTIAKNDVTGYDVTDFVAGLTYNYDEAATLEVKASAWSMYRAWFTVYPTTTTYAFSYKESGEQLGEVVVESQRGTAAQYEERSIPGHEHDYVFGHGHGHGHGDENAGGGIVLPD